MLRYTLLALVVSCIIMCGIALNSSVTTPTVNSLLEKLQELNGSLVLAQQTFYVYGLNQWKMQNNVIERNDYLITPGIGAHKLHTRQLPWNNARKVCIMEGGHLAIINSISEEKLLLRILEENKIIEAWLGIHDLYEIGDWTTIMDENLELTGYSKWTTALEGINVPDHINKHQHCGVLLARGNGGLNDRECHHAKSFFCEINL